LAYTAGLAQVLALFSLNQLSDAEVRLLVRTGMSSIVVQRTRGNNKMDRIYELDNVYDGITVVRSTMTSDQMAICVCSHSVKTVGTSRRVFKFGKHMAAKPANFLSSVLRPVYRVNKDGDPQEEFDRRYNYMSELLNVCYPELPLRQLTRRMSRRL